jgi:hypothetical protein
MASVLLVLVRCWLNPSKMNTSPESSGLLQLGKKWLSFNRRMGLEEAGRQHHCVTAADTSRIASCRDEHVTHDGPGSPLACLETGRTTCRTGTLLGKLRRGNPVRQRFAAAGNFKPAEPDQSTIAPWRAFADIPSSSHKTSRMPKGSYRVGRCLTEPCLCRLRVGALGQVTCLPVCRAGWN